MVILSEILDPSSRYELKWKIRESKKAKVLSGKIYRNQVGYGTVQGLSIQFTIKVLGRVGHLNQKLLTPIVQIIKRLHDINIIYKNTAISSTIESNTKTLKSFLTCCVPYLDNFIRQSNKEFKSRMLPN